MADLTVPLSRCILPTDGTLQRQSPRPPELRNAAYAAQFDWHTLFYDVFRADDHIVFQGPPLFNLLEPLRASAPFDRALRGWWKQARLVERNRISEIWLRGDADQLRIDGPIGQWDITVQPDMAAMFAGRRVLHTLSKDNEIRWIRDWIRFYRDVHGADAVLFYDNNSTRYSAADLRGELRAAFPEMVIEVVAWPFLYGPQGGMAGAVDGQEAPWDSDYCQSGSLQHARFRFLRRARSVLNVDIDELVLSNQGRQIFAATEQSRAGFIKFPGRWITGLADRPIANSGASLGDFVLYDRQEQVVCPPKWCVVPHARQRWGQHWSVHNIFGARANRHLSDEFTYRHMRAISNNWKADRREDQGVDETAFATDEALSAAFTAIGLR